MKLLTKNFGEIEITENDIIEFAVPMPGLDDKKRFVFMIDESLNGEFIWLQSADDGDLCFVMADPSKFLKDYAPTFSEDTEKLLGAGRCEMWLIMVVADDFSESTVNLKSPVIVNTETRKGAQLIAEEEYTFRYKLFREGE